MSRLRVLVCSAALAAVAAQPASAAPLLPPSGKVFHGVTGGDSLTDARARLGRAPAVWQHFVQWGGNWDYAIRRTEAAGTRLMLHVSTADGQHRPGRITPGAIARGEGDRFLVHLTRRLARHGGPTYLRVMGEMNNCDNAYAALNCNGSRRSPDHSPRRFVAAWRRMHTILQGGRVAAIDGRLQSLRQRPLQGTAAEELPRPSVALVWAPMTGGSPMVAALAPERYWPGRRFVDWVGTSFYSRYPNFHYLEPFYRRYAVAQRRPFALAEWAMWGSDDAAFARRLFGWIRTHRRVRMVQYNQGSLSHGPFRLRRYPQAQKVIEDALDSARFVAGPLG